MVFLTAFNVLFPLFAKISLGYAVRHMGLLSEKTLREMNNLVFRLFLPLLLFSNIYKTDFSTITSYDLLWFAVLSLVVMFGSYMFLIPRVEQENHKRGVLVQAICRSNFIFFGIPMATTLYGGTSAGIASLMVGVVVPLVNMNSVIALEYFRGNTPNYPKILRGIIVNPIIIGGLLGLLCAFTGFKLPRFLEQFVFEIADIATPLALIILGGSVTFTSMKTNLKPLLIGVFNRLVIVPAIGLTASILIGFRSVELVLLMSMFASPAAVSSYTMAQQMDGDAELAGQLVVFTTVFSLVTLFFWISGLMAFGFIQ
ncbi:MAG: AEC family transporter [Sphaerochaetaceae bacterium]|nr:AEC family transporter [Sphaerochaetaceae bacterium]MDD3941054.1 AEC family transporter [Sphaerochaetaceae bacterium]